MTQNVAGWPKRITVERKIVNLLSRSLYSDFPRAIRETVSNSYDADASYAKVSINTTGEVDIHGLKYPTDNGVIIIEDDGFGMSYKRIEDGWLTISNSEKRNMKKRGETTNLGRSPLGDKGLGRLACQRLGDNIEFKTYSEKTNKAFHVGFSWKDFVGDSLLKDIPVKFAELSSVEKRGTKIIISKITEDII